VPPIASATTTAASFAGFGAPLDRVLDQDGLVGLQAELGRVLAGGERRYRQWRIQLELAGLDLLEQQIERHDLGERGGMTRRVRVLLMQNLAGIVVDHDRGVRRIIVGTVNWALVPRVAAFDALRSRGVPGSFPRRMRSRARRIGVIPPDGGDRQHRQSTGDCEAAPRQSESQAHRRHSSPVARRDSPHLTATTAVWL
jgi:hypothetical protein